MDFIAIDFETANEQQFPCSLGITIVENSEIKDCRSCLINPESVFSDRNIDIHGIHPADVATSPTFPEIWKIIGEYLCMYPIVAHNASFDLSVLCKSLFRYNIEVPNFTYYCTYQMSRNIFPNLEKHTLDFLCDSLCIELNDHHACDADSLACAKLMLYFLDNYPDFIVPKKYFYYPHNTRCVNTIEMKAGNANFDDTSDLICFSGKNFVVTGKFSHFSRNEIKEYITSRGGCVKGSVSQKTDYLIVGDMDTSVIKDKEHVKSQKIIDAERIEQETGKDILILSEETFMELENLRNAQLSFNNAPSKNDIYYKIREILIEGGIEPDAITFSPNKSNLDSISIYGSLLLSFHIGKSNYIQIKNGYAPIFKAYGIMCSSINSNPDYVRIHFTSFDLSTLSAPIIEMAKKFSPSTTFDCCDLCVACSDAMKCLHKDQVYSLQCSYRKKLQNGIVFFGKNRNVD